ncbi:MAG TPA: molybdopterin converting factor subunit 1 [Solirubrobacterales bacterium]|nr:molybdopterin converting factor subunit 1 [Solirubrobacterales bacterium]
MTVTVRLFAMLRERAGRDEIELELGDGSTVADALEALKDSSPLGEALERMPVRAAVNREYVADDSPLSPGDEVALIPPVSGGAPGAGEDVHARVTGAPLAPQSLSRAVGRPGAGAIVTFQGMTRAVDRLEYEAYAEMAQRRIEAILRECLDRHGLEAAAAEHRVGTVPLGEPSVVVAVSAAHRDEAFAAAREAIDRIKAEAPIWKQEVEDSGDSRWVEGAIPPTGGAEQ